MHWTKAIYSFHREKKSLFLLSRALPKRQTSEWVPPLLYHPQRRTNSCRDECIQRLLSLLGAPSPLLQKPPPLPSDYPAAPFAWQRHVYGHYQCWTKRKKKGKKNPHCSAHRDAWSLLHAHSSATSSNRESCLRRRAGQSKADEAEPRG